MNKFLEKLKLKRPQESEETLARLIPDSVKYVLVEKKMDEEHFRQGVKLLDGKYAGLIFTTSPKIGLIPQEDGSIKLAYSYVVERLPAGMKEDEVSFFEMEKIVGDVIMDIINQDHNDKE